ncbi:hypothetical protein [Nocardia rhamnosiphila]|uniref:DUF2613 domain-containing protein n=1 Tax=Nocardia rhamnosiphila TaxID=426716 RepID=A0ABV2WYX3_9NOCA
MNTPSKFAGFALGLAAVFGIAKGTVRTAEFTVRVAQGNPGPATPAEHAGGQPGHGH